MRTAISCLLVSLSVGILVGAPTAAGAQTTADLFNDQVLHDVRLLINSKDLRQLRARWQENVYFPADLVWNGQRVRNVGIRPRGTGSRNPVKLGLTVDFARYAKNQRFLGLNELVLDNLWQDASLMREMLAMSVYRRMGSPAPREAFARLYINNEYQGLYALVEPVNTIFVQRVLGESTGYLFEYRLVMPFYTEYLGDDLSAYAPLFQPRNHQLDSPSVLYEPIRDLFRDINMLDDVAWRGHVEERLDLAAFMRHVAVQAFLGENDGILGFWGLNNFYLYRYAGTSQHRILPWDEDSAFTYLTTSLFTRGSEPVVLFDRAVQEEDLRALFLDVVESCALNVTGDGWLAGEIERVVILVGDAARADTKKQFSNEDFDAQVAFLRTFASARTDYVMAEVKALRAGTGQ